MYSSNVPFNIFSMAVVLFSFFIALCFVVAKGKTNGVPKLKMGSFKRAC